jgi:type IV secretion system protein TrbI
MQFHNSPRARWSFLLVGGGILVIVAMVATWLLMRQAPAEATKATTQPISAPTDREHWIPAAMPTPSPVPLATATPAAPMMHQASQAPYVQAHVPSAQEQQRKEDARRGMQSDLAFQNNAPGGSTTTGGDSRVLETPRIKSVSQNTDDSPISGSFEPASPFTITPGTWMHAILDTGVISDDCGPVLAHISADVRDSVTQSNVLIPAGSKLIGKPKCEGFNQQSTRLQISWRQIEFPNGGELIVPNMPGGDIAGYGGLEDEINHHYAARLAPALLTSAISAAISMAQSPYSNNYGGSGGYGGVYQVNPEQLALSGAASNFGQQAIGEVRQGQEIKNTITLRPGLPLAIMFPRRVIFDRAYPEDR